MTEPLPDAEYLPRRTAPERVARGQSLRAEVPVERHGAWVPPPERGDPIAVLERQSAQRVPELVPIRYGRMAASPFAFFRGAAAVMAADLAGTPVSGLHAQLCGDAHLLNFGIFETPERTLVFGLNDFDETLPGPIEWDVKRLAASIEIAGRDLGFAPAERHAAVVAAIGSYREALQSFAAMRNLDVWHARLPAKELDRHVSVAGDQQAHRAVKRSIHKALRHDHLGAFAKLVTRDDGTLRFVSNPPLLVPVEELLEGEHRERYVAVVRAGLEHYRDSLVPHTRAFVESYRFLHMARKVVGVGSVGTRAWVMLFMGRDAGDPLLLQFKEATSSVLEPYAGSSGYASAGRRVVEGQRYMQAASDALLGWCRLPLWDGVEREFYVRQLWDGKASVDVGQMTPAGLAAYGDSCGWTLARGHARSGDRLAMAAYVGQDAAFEEAMASFAQAYADVNEADHTCLVEAIGAGRVRALADV